MSVASNVFNSIGHFFAKAVKVYFAVEPKIEAGAQEVLDNAGKIEAITALVPKFGPLAVGIEDLGFALLGEVLAALKANAAAAEQKFADIGLDKAVIDSVKAVAADPLIQKVAKLV